MIQQLDRQFSIANKLRTQTHSSDHHTKEMSRTRKVANINLGMEELEVDGCMWIPFSNFQKFSSVFVPKGMPTDDKYIQIKHVGRDSSMNQMFTTVHFVDKKVFSIDSSDIYPSCCLEVEDSKKLTPAAIGAFSVESEEKTKRKRASSKDESGSDSEVKKKKINDGDPSKTTILDEREKSGGSRVLVLENANCHICHARRPKVYNACTKGFRQHSFCLDHAVNKLKIPSADLKADLSVFPPCPACNLTCPCAACQRKKSGDCITANGGVPSKTAAPPSKTIGFKECENGKFSDRSCERCKRLKKGCGREWPQCQRCQTCAGGPLDCVYAGDAKRVDSGQSSVVQKEALEVAEFRVMHSGCCHICHGKANKVYGKCPKGLTSHAFCEKHIQSKFGVDPDALERDPSLFPPCPVCDLSCPCASCTRKKVKRDVDGQPSLPLKTNSKSKPKTKPPHLDTKVIAKSSASAPALSKGGTGDPWTDIGNDHTSISKQQQQNMGRILEKRGQSQDQISIREHYQERLMNAFPMERKGILHVLEVGCGTGVVTRAFAGLQEISSIVGLDPSPILINEAKSLLNVNHNSDHGKIEYQIGNAESLPFSDFSFDMVIFHTTLIHIPRARLLPVLKEAFRVLTGGGVVSIFDNDPPGWNIKTSEFDPLNLCLQAILTRGDRDFHMCQKLPSLLVQAGFNCEDGCLKKYTILDTDEQSYGMTIILRGADHLFNEGHISKSLSNELVNEAKTRADKGQFNLNMCYAHCFGVKIDDDTVNI